MRGSKSNKGEEEEEEEDENCCFGLLTGEAKAAEGEAGKLDEGEKDGAEDEKVEEAAAALTAD